MPNLSQLDDPALQRLLEALRKEPGNDLEQQAVLHELQVHQIELEQQNRELQLVQAELEASRNRYAELYDQAPIGYVTLTAHGLIKEINLTACVMLGAERQRVLQKPFRKFLAPNDSKAFFKHLSDAIKSQCRQSLETQIRQASGEIFEARLETACVRFTNTEPDCLLVLSDLTERKRFERELTQARKLEAVGQLTAGLGHDFNNMLATIIGFAELIEMRAGNLSAEKLLNYTKSILFAGYRGKDLVAQMLTFARATPSNDSSPVALEPLVSEMLNILWSVLPSSIETDVQIAKDLPLVCIDPGKFQQVLMNLCVNARDAMDGKGHLSVRLHTVRIEDAECSTCHKRFNGLWVELAVSDSGPGIDKQLQSRLFDPFFTTKETGKGTGMGLAVVHGIVTQADGHVLLDQQAGSGACFRILLPIADRMADEPMDEAVDEPAKTEMIAGQGQHILVLDDELQLGKFLKALLEGSGYRVSLFSDSLEAVERLEQPDADFDLLITDQTMPKMTGVEVAAVLRDRQLRLPVILCSGYSEQVNAKTAARLGIDRYLEKPIDANQLLQAMSDLLTAGDKSQ